MNGQHSNDDNQNSDRLVIRKRIINHRNKQIETRIKRKIILEDGIVISDSGPLVTTKTIEDTKQEFEEFGPFSNDAVGQNNRPDNDDSQKVNKTKSKVPDSYLFGYGDHQIASCSASNKTKHDLPNYYFGQTKIKNSDKKPFNEISDGGNRSMWQQNVDTINQQKKDNHGNKLEADDFHERDCQYIYEYGNFSRYRF